MGLQFLPTAGHITSVTFCCLTNIMVKQQNDADVIRLQYPTTHFATYTVHHDVDMNSKFWQRVGGGECFNVNAFLISYFHFVIEYQCLL